MPREDDPPIAAAAALAANEGEPPLPPRPRRPLSLRSTLLFGLYLTAVAFLLPRLFPSFTWPPQRRHPIFVMSDVMKLGPDLRLFTVTSRPLGVSPTHRVLILPGLAAGASSFRHVYCSLASRGLLAAVLDLPGQGRSPACLPHRTSEPQSSSSPHAIVARAVDALGVTPVHLVLHDPALTVGAAFAAANPGAARSVTLIDAAASSAPAFPAAVLRVMAPPLFRGLLRLCCVRGMRAEAAREHRTAMMVRTQGVVEAWKALNRSFELASGGLRRRR